MSEETTVSEGGDDATNTNTDTATTDTTTQEAWYAGLPEEIRANPALTRYATIEDAARGLIHANGKLRAAPETLLQIPKPDDQDGQGKFWNAVGRPETPDGYKDIAIPDGSPFDKDALSGFLATMHGAGPFTPEMAKAAVDWYSNYAKQVGTDMQGLMDKAKTDGEAALKGEWGDAYQVKLDAAASAALKFGGEDLKAYLDETGLGNDPRLLKAWAGVADAMREAGAPPHEKGRDGPRPLTPTEAEAELAKMQTDEKVMAALQNASDPNHKHYTERRLELIRLKNAGQSQ